MIRRWLAREHLRLTPRGQRVLDVTGGTAFIAAYTAGLSIAAAAVGRW